MRLIMSAIVAIALIVVATFVRWPRAPSIELSTAAMPSLEDFHTIAGVNKLPVQDTEDQSLIYPTGTKQ
jgi:hypothetical protein